MEDSLKLGITLFLIAIFILGSVSYKWWDYSQGKETDLVCNRIVTGSRFSTCEDNSEFKFGYFDKYKVRVCQPWGSKDITEDVNTSSHIQYRYCEDYYYKVNKDNITIWRVR